MRSNRVYTHSVAMKYHRPIFRSFGRLSEYMSGKRWPYLPWRDYTRAVTLMASCLRHVYGYSTVGICDDKSEHKGLVECICGACIGAFRLPWAQDKLFATRGFRLPQHIITILMRSYYTNAHGLYDIERAYVQAILGSRRDEGDVPIHFRAHAKDDDPRVSFWLARDASACRMYSTELLGVAESIQEGIGHYHYSMEDALLFMTYNEFGERRCMHNRIGVNMSSTFVRTMRLESNVSFEKYSLQTWATTQTPVIRQITKMMRIQYLYKGPTAKANRVVILKQFYDYCPMEYFDGVRNNAVGVIRQGEKFKDVELSGHLANLLVSSLLYVVDFRRYFDTVEANIRMMSGVKTVVRQYNELKAHEALAEAGGQFFHLWHTYLDYQSSLIYGMYLAAKNGLLIDIRRVRYIKDRLEDLRIRYPIFAGADILPKDGSPYST